MGKIFWSLSALASVVAGLVLFVGVAKANGAPQEASSAAIALGIAVIPYVWARAWEGMAKKKD